MKKAKVTIIFKEKKVFKKGALKCRILLSNTHNYRYIIIILDSFQGNPKYVKILL